MARGKHGQAAAVRHEVQTRDAEIATYQRAVARLTAENKELRASLERERSLGQQRDREWRTRLDEGVSPRVEALQRELAVKRDEVSQARAALERTRQAGSVIIDEVVRQLEGRGVAAKTIYEVVAEVQSMMFDQGNPAAVIRRRRESQQNYGFITPDVERP